MAADTGLAGAKCGVAVWLLCTQWEHLSYKQPGVALWNATENSDFLCFCCSELWILNPWNCPLVAPIWLLERQPKGKG